MVKTFSNQNSLNLDVGKIENQISCLQVSIQNQIDRLANCMFQLGIYKKDERFAWDRLKENGKDHKDLQGSCTKLNCKHLKMFEKVVCQEKHIYQCNLCLLG
jgi:hypothetical protein